MTERRRYELSIGIGPFDRAPRACSNCGVTVVHAHGRCAPCATYYAKYHQERREGLIVRLAKRKLGAEDERRLKSQRICGDPVYLGPEAWCECERPPGHIATGKPHQSWVGEWYWDRNNLIFIRRHRLLVDLGA